jgi:hypothetical protein
VLESIKCASRTTHLFTLPRSSWVRSKQVGGCYLQARFCMPAMDFQRRAKNMRLPAA